MKTSDFDFDLPEHFIAQTPIEPRDSSKLLVYNRAADRAEVKHFYDIVDYLKKGDVVVINTTKVMAARLTPLERVKEVLLLKKVDTNTYEVLVKPLKRLRLNDTVKFAHRVVGELLSKNNEHGTAIMRFNMSPEAIGETPLPHYIKIKSPCSRYDTVYAGAVGSAAAPTAGLHWTPELMQKARDKGVIFCEILLHVGLGTFRPVKVENITEHRMHSEYFQVTEAAAKIINDAKKEGRRIIACGTTSVRTLESVYSKHGYMVAETAETDIFIYPPYKFGVIDAIITNFHLPKSTLLMLVAAFLNSPSAGASTPLRGTDGFGTECISCILKLYELAKQNEFRFFSLGDACFFC